MRRHKHRGKVLETVTKNGITIKEGTWIYGYLELRGKKN